MKSEDKIQSEIFQWFWNSFPDYLIHAVPNGGHRNVVEALKLKSTGTVPGVADLIIHLPNAKCVMCEVKTEIGTQSTAQKKIEAKIKAMGGNYILVRSLEDFKGQIKKFIL